MSFVWSAPIRFGHCDPAGIAYFPRLFELLDAAVEEWTAATLIGRAAMHLDMRLALPMVDCRSRFVAPCRLGEMLDIALAVTAVGTRSVGFAAHATVGGAARFDVTMTQVLMGLDTARAVPWPADWRARLQP